LEEKASKRTPRGDSAKGGSPDDNLECWIKKRTRRGIAKEAPVGKKV